MDSSLFAGPSGGKKVVIGMVSLPPLPGTYLYQGQELKAIENNAVSDALKMRDAGMDGIMLQNAGDLPARKKVGLETVAFMTAIGKAVREAVGAQFPIGVSVLKNDAEAALAVAEAIQGDFVRLKVYVGAMVSAEGITEGCAEEALMYKRCLNSRVSLVADVYDRTGVPLGNMSLEEAAGYALSKGQAEALVITGKDFGQSLEWIQRVKQAYPTATILLGGSASPDNVERALAVADGVIVGTSIKKDAVVTNPIDQTQLDLFMKRVKRVG